MPPEHAGSPSKRSCTRGESVRHSPGTTLLVAQSERGLCAILLGDDPEALLRDLQDRFPNAELVGGEPGFERVVATVVGFVEAPRLGLELPLDIRGTAFQQRVWQALRDPARTPDERALLVFRTRYVVLRSCLCPVNRQSLARPR